MIRERKPTIFEQKVFDLVRTIPAGKVSTYGDIAAALGMRSSQAIGQALRRNPFAPEVPCHRVIRESGEVGQFRWGAERKHALQLWEAANNTG
jgi:O-6-methylguanine DNA methyltransferase